MLQVREGGPAGHLVHSWAELERAYPEQWVVALDVDFLGRRNLEFRSARIVGCGADREQALAHARPEIERVSAYCCWYTKPLEIVSFRLLGL